MGAAALDGCGSLAAVEAVLGLVSSDVPFSTNAISGTPPGYDGETVSQHRSAVVLLRFGNGLGRRLRRPRYRGEHSLTDVGPCAHFSWEHEKCGLAKLAAVGADLRAARRE
jgi:hypothetical protein